MVIDYLREAGSTFLFGVPGTSEIPLIDGAAAPGSGLTYVPCLHENIAVGAAMGFARMTGRPGAVQLHATPGIAHALGNLYNAFTARIPLVVLCGQQHSGLLVQEPLLASDLVAAARQYSKWAHEVRDARELAVVMQRAFKEALAPPTRPVFISLPWDVLLTPVSDPGTARITRVGSRFIGAAQSIAAAATVLAGAYSPVIIAGDEVGASGAWNELAVFADQLGAPIYGEPAGSYQNCPPGLPHFRGELALSQAAAHEQLRGHDAILLCGMNYPSQVLLFDSAAEMPLAPVPAQVHLHSDPWELGKNAYAAAAILGDVQTTLPQLGRAVARDPLFNALLASRRTAAIYREGAAIRDQRADRTAQLLSYTENEPVHGSHVAAMLATLQPQLPVPMVFVNESFADAPAFRDLLSFDDPVSYFCVPGSSLGFSMPASIGIKLAVGDSRVVVDVVGDGSALFYPQAWWTAARLSLPVLTIVMNNRAYQTLESGVGQLDQLYQWRPGSDPWYLRLDDPPVRFVEVAAGFGIDGLSVTYLSDLREALIKGLDVVLGGRPYVIEVLIGPDKTIRASISH
ncbi:MAG: benzoylformate decarboxylase [Actinoplanes sp.]|nr:benzoylformate decarboxylase [Actinoplanes sp.]